MSERPYLRSAALLVLAGSLMLGSCICTTSGVNRGDVNLIPIEEEWQMGEVLEQQLARELPLVQDPEAMSYLNGLGRQLVDETELAEQAWEIHIVADSSINAFAVPGGHVYVHTGLITAADNVAELAGVMAHEIAHGVARHSTERLTAVYGIDVIASLILGESPGILQQIAAQLIGSGTIAKFSRDDEREADRLGLQLMHGAGFDPAAMATMFETLLANRRRRPNIVERFFASHPLTEERIATVREEAAGLAEGQELLTEDPAFRRIQERLNRTSW